MNPGRVSEPGAGEGCDDDRCSYTPRAKRPTDPGIRARPARPERCRVDCL